MSVNTKDFLPKVEIVRNDRDLIDIFVDGEKLADISHIAIELYPQQLPVINMNYGQVQKDENGHIQVAIADGKKAIAIDHVSLSASSLKIDI